MQRYNVIPQECVLAWQHQSEHFLPETKVTCSERGSNEQDIDDRARSYQDHFVLDRYSEKVKKLCSGFDARMRVFNLVVTNVPSM